jgi:hypothetical protein
MAADLQKSEFEIEFETEDDWGARFEAARRFSQCR